jgi:PAS domain S-box-containing protein
MGEPLKILVIEDRPADFLLLERHLRLKGLPASLSRVDSPGRLQEAVQAGGWDVVLTDFNVPSLDFEQSLALLQEAMPDVPLIMVTGTLGEEKAVELLKQGVWDFVLKDNLARLVPAIERSLADAAGRRERKGAEQALRQSEAMYHSLFDNMLNCVAHCRVICAGETLVDFVILSVNDAFVKQTGLRDVVGKRFTEVIPGIRESDPELFERYGRVARTGEPERFEIYLESMKTWFWISAYRPGQDQFITVFDVITERKLAEKALRASEERLDLALRGANEGLWDWNLKTGELYLSPRWKSLLGHTDEELASSYGTWLRLLHPEDRELAAAQLNDFLEGRSAQYQAEYRMGHRDGHYVDILARAFLVFDDRGDAVRMVGTHADVTERKKLELQYRQAQKMEAIGQLAGGVAHDFNNILSAIFGYSHLILDQARPDDFVAGYVQEIMRASQRAADLTKGLLTFSRLQATSLAVIDLAEVVGKLEPFLRRLIREDVELTVTGSEPLPILADRGQIEQVIMNLVANARDALPNGGRLCIETRQADLDQGFVEAHGYGREGSYALLSVSDNGLGMERQTQARIFEPFFTTKEQGQGTGLGLSMAYGIVRKHVGIINVYSEPGLGTVFKVYLPRVQAAAEPAAREARGPVALLGGTETILLGEDDAALRKLSLKVLSRYGYRIIEAVDGQDAIDKFVAHVQSIQLVILDAIMPKKNGKEACLEMRKLRPDLKTVFVSGYARDLFDEDSTLNGNSVFLQKPVTPSELLAKVRELLDRGQPQPAAGKPREAALDL